MARTNIFIIFLLLAIMIPSCIMPYEPEIESRNINKFVVSGQVTDNNEYQTVSVSKASPVGEPQYTPVSGCLVNISDDKGNEFVMQETVAGTYRCRIEKKYLIPDASFKVEISTSDGINIESDFDRMSECPEVDSVYYTMREIPSNVPGENTRGIQFYLDLDCGGINSRFFRWEVIETWEYHSDYPMEWYYDGTVHHIFPPDYSRKVCWSTELIKNIYTLSTEGLVENKYFMLPLNFVGNHTSRLMYGYNLLINQFALSEAAYSYWDQLRINSSEQGGLYEKQPLAIRGNLHNKTNPGDEVLGFFSVSSVKSKRIFLRKVENLELDFAAFCNPWSPRKGFREIDPADFPVFMMGDKYQYYMVFFNRECVDCLAMGGTNVKPVFWPD